MTTKQNDVWPWPKGDGVETLICQAEQRFRLDDEHAPAAWSILLELHQLDFGRRFGPRAFDSALDDFENDFEIEFEVIENGA